MELDPDLSAAISHQIWDKKYRLKTLQGEPIDHTVKDTWWRVARALAEAEKAPDFLSSTTRDLQEAWAQKFYDAMEGFKFIPAGRIIAGAGSARRVTLFNCYVMGTIPDSMSGIFESLKEAALTMQQGGGIGYDFSTLRPKGAPVKQVAADASGPLTFMDVWDAMCRTIMSAGSRRGAMMGTMRCDHPDIFEFIEAKRTKGRLNMFNMSVLVTDAFMQAVDADADWPLKHEVAPMGESEQVDGRWVYRTVKARNLWDKIMRSTYDYAEPGVIFIDRVNESNNLRAIETIAASNPCGEQMLPPYGACLLGSINLAALVEDAYGKRPGIDEKKLQDLVRVAIRMMDNVNDVSLFPLDKQKEQAQAKRRLGLGITGLADALVMCGLTYGTPKAIERTEKWLEIIAVAAYEAGVSLAREKGAFPLFDAEEFLAPGTFAAERLPDWLKSDIREVGIRNSHYLSIAPTGTISLWAGNLSGGIEPIFASSYVRKVLEDDGSKREERVVDYAVAVWEEKQAQLVIDSTYHQPVPPSYIDAQSLEPEAHVHMQAVAQKWMDSSISKTINVPEDIDFERFQGVYQLAYETGCKGCTTYRPNETLGSVLSVDKPQPKPEEMLVGHPDEPETTPLTDELLIEEARLFLKAGGNEELSNTRKGQMLVKLKELGVERVKELTGPEKIDDAHKLYHWMVIESTPLSTVLDPNRELTRREVWDASIAWLGHRDSEGYETRMQTLQNYKKQLGITQGMDTTQEQRRELMKLFDPELEQLSDYPSPYPEGDARRWIIEADKSGKFLERIQEMKALLRDLGHLPSSAPELDENHYKIKAEEPPVERPLSLDGSVYKIKLGDTHATYVTVTDIEDEHGRRRPFEVFISTKNPEHFAWSTALTRMISAVFRRPHDSAFVVEELKAVFDPRGGGFWQGQYWNSTVAAIGRVIEVHMEKIGYLEWAGTDWQLSASDHQPGEIAEVDEPEEGYTHGRIVSSNPNPQQIARDGDGGLVACEKCFSFDVKFEAGCATCLSCGHSKCG